MRVAVPFPFVPTTWIDGYASCGWPSSRSSARMCSSPNSSGHGLSDSIQLVAESVELTAVALQLLALGLDDVRRRVLHEALVREHPFRARDLLLQAGDLGGRVAVAAAAPGLHDRLEDASALLVERRADSAAAEDRRRVLNRLQRVAVLRVHRLSREPR